MSNNEMISIVIPVYNGGKTIAECLKSIMDQTYKNLEIICVDDHSDDNTLEILSDISKKDNRVKVIEKETNTGVSAARNIGIRKASGYYLQFVDADDTLELDMCDTMVKMMKRHNADMAVCNFYHPCLTTYLGDCVLDFSHDEDIYKFCQNTFSGVVPWCRITKRAAIKDFFDENLSFAEDEIFVFDNLKYMKKVVSTSKKLYHYNVAPPDADPSELSCISAIGQSKDFWKTKKTYWYYRAALIERQKSRMPDGFGGKYSEDILYARQFDYLIWEAFLFVIFDASVGGIMKEIAAVFKDDRFRYVMKLKEKHGIRFVYKEENVPLFVLSVVSASKDYLKSNYDYKVYDVCLSIFAYYFTEFDGSRLDMNDQLVEAAVNNEDQLTFESRKAFEYLQNGQEEVKVARAAGIC